MGAAGPNNPSAAANNTGIGTVAWTNPSNALASDDSYAVSGSVGLGTTSNYLTLTDFGFALPSDAAITKIVVSVERHASVSNQVRDATIKLIKGGVVGGTNLAGTTWPFATDASVDYDGGLWGQSWTAGDINAADFGVAIAITASVGGGGSRTGSVDTATIAVTYNTPGSVLVASSTLSFIEGSARSRFVLLVASSVLGLIEGRASASVSFLRGLVIKVAATSRRIRARTTVGGVR